MQKAGALSHSNAAEAVHLESCAAETLERRGDSHALHGRGLAGEPAAGNLRYESNSTKKKNYACWQAGTTPAGRSGTDVSVTHDTQEYGTDDRHTAMLVIPTPEIDDKHSHPVGSSEAAPRAHTHAPTPTATPSSRSIRACRSNRGLRAHTRAHARQPSCARSARSGVCREGVGGGRGGRDTGACGCERRLGCAAVTCDSEEAAAEEVDLADVQLVRDEVDDAPRGRVV